MPWKHSSNNHIVTRLVERDKSEKLMALLQDLRRTHIYLIVGN